MSAQTKLAPAGRVSRTTTLLAVLGPLFVVTIVYVRFCAALTVAGPDFETARSASSPTVVVTRFAAAEPLLFVVSGSAVDAAARATLASVPVAGAVAVAAEGRVAPF